MKKLLSATLLFALLPLVCAHAADKKIVIHNFNPNRDGSYTTGGLLLNQGNFYGATLRGNIFELTPSGSGGSSVVLAGGSGSVGPPSARCCGC